MSALLFPSGRLMSRGQHIFTLTRTPSGGSSRYILERTGSGDRATLVYRDGALRGQWDAGDGGVVVENIELNEYGRQHWPNGLLSISSQGRHLGHFNYSESEPSAGSDSRI